MEKTSTSCFKFTDKIKCTYCKGENLIKNGHTKTGKQQYYCKQCKKYVIISYSYNAYQTRLNPQIVALTKEGVGIRGISRLLEISQNTVLSRIKQIASQIKEPVLVKGKEYEVDELRTFIQKKNRLIWVVSALRKDTGEIVRCSIGSRTNKTLKRVTESLQLSEAKKIYTDDLKQYKTLIDNKIHKTRRFCTNHIERYHLNLRTHLKRLNRRSICYSKSLCMLSAVLKIYLWG